MPHDTNFSRALVSNSLLVGGTRYKSRTSGGINIEMMVLYLRKKYIKKELLKDRKYLTIQMGSKIL